MNTDTFLDVAALLSNDMRVLRERNVNLQGDPSSLGIEVGQDQLSSLLYSRGVTKDFQLGGLQEREEVGKEGRREREREKRKRRCH